MKHLKVNKAKPIYLKIYDTLRTNLERGDFPYKSKFPSKRILAEEWGVSIITIEHALELLCEEGYLTARERSGYYVEFRSADFFSSGLTQNNTFENSLIFPNNPQAKAKKNTLSEFPFSVFSKAMRKVLNDVNTALFNRSPNEGLSELRTAVSKYLARSRDIVAHPEQIIIGSGAEYLYSLIAELFDDNYIYGIENPCYEKIRQVYEAYGRKTELLEIENDGIKSEQLAETRANILHITPYKSYPSGVTASATKRHEYIAWVNGKNERLLIEDDFASEFSTLRKPEATLFSMSEKVIYMNTFSNTISNSLRIGYMVLPQKLLPLYRKRLGFYSCTVPTFEQYVIAELIESGEFERHINRIRRKNRQELKLQ